jgi:uncharacterized protein (TIGR02646 family)
MIPVRRTEIPPVLKRNGEKWLKKLKEVKANPTATKNQIDNAIKKYNHPDVREALISMFHGKCAYCESKIERGRIEHFKPKSEYEYIDLTFDWDNLLYSCEVCNDTGHKGDKFPIDNQGNYLLIDPTDENCDIYEHLEFLYQDGYATISFKDKRGKVVIDILKLNRTDLMESRTKKIKGLLAILKIFIETGSLEARELLKEAYQLDSEYSAFALFYILPYLAHHFRIPEAIELIKKVSKRSPTYAQFARIDNLDN